jgi:hypothetical protein
MHHARGYGGKYRWLTALRSAFVNKELDVLSYQRTRQGIDLHILQKKSV